MFSFVLYFFLHLVIYYGNHSVAIHIARPRSFLPPSPSLPLLFLFNNWVVWLTSLGVSTKFYYINAWTFRELLIFCNYALLLLCLSQYIYVFILLKVYFQYTFLEDCWVKGHRQLQFCETLSIFPPQELCHFAFQPAVHKSASFPTASPIECVVKFLKFCLSDG